MLRTYRAPDFFTLLNASLGTLAIFSCLKYSGQPDVGTLWAAASLLAAALGCDFLDGWVARRTRRGSILGADLDSLADVISFGVAPAVFGYTIGLVGGWDIVCLTFFVVAGVSRLARFNATADAFQGPTGKVTHFEGTPIPTNIVIVALLSGAVFFERIGDNVWGGQWNIGPGILHPLSLIYVASGFSMISSVRIPKL